MSFNATLAVKHAPPWRDNAPRHSFGTYYFKITKDPGEVIKAMGTSLKEFETSYWNKSRLVTEDSAREWFGIYPEIPENVVPLGADSQIVAKEHSNAPGQPSLKCV